MSPGTFEGISAEQLTPGGVGWSRTLRRWVTGSGLVLHGRAAVAYCSMWPGWEDGRAVHPAACCSASPPMRARLALSRGPMRAARSGLGSRVGLFNLRGGQQAAPSAPDGCVSAMVTLSSLSINRAYQCDHEHRRGPACVPSAPPAFCGQCHRGVYKRLAAQFASELSRAR